MKTFLSTLRPKTRRTDAPRPRNGSLSGPLTAPLTARRRRLMAGTGIAVASAVLITGAIIYPGFKTTEVELNDGGVWVVSKSKNAVGRLNYPSRVLDGAVTPASAT
ncbi:MAG TPA: hypothetical protein VLT34_01350, partial [Arthrobacter sp.]|nr:hypothetical protein [Arthrobacter sp.]